MIYNLRNKNILKDIAKYHVNFKMEWLYWILYG